MDNHRQFIMNRLERFYHAFEGLFFVFRSEANAKIHLLAAGLVIGMGLYFKISFDHWVMLLIAISIVIAGEIFNTAIEKLCDHIHLDYHPAIRNIKHVAAGGVLILAISAAIMGVIIFSQYL